MSINIIFYRFLALAFVFSHLTGCAKEDKVQPVDFRTFSIAGVCEGSVLKSSAEKEKTTVITSEPMLLKETGCLTSPPQVDFKTHFVLAGRVAFDNCAKLLEETIVETDNVIKYNIKILKVECQKLDTVYFMASLPIRYKDRQITFNVEE